MFFNLSISIIRFLYESFNSKDSKKNGILKDSKKKMKIQKIRKKKRIFEKKKRIFEKK